MDIDVVQSVLDGIPLCKAVTGIRPLLAGFSTDLKFILSANDEPVYLLRLSDKSETERRGVEFQVLRQLHSAGIPCSEPCYHKSVPEYGVCATLLRYIAGECAENVLPEISETAQCAVGTEAGEVLRRMHGAVDVPISRKWRNYREAKYRRMVTAARKMKLRFGGQHVVEQYVETNLHLLNGRPVAFQHDDYHPGNLIINSGRLTGVIDFNRIDWGDPWHDFYKMAHFAAPLWPAFACGQVDGYFGGTVPDDFWPLYTLYVAMSLHS
ncbi:MAG: phosphotransferase, partial [Armatimonadetes bacterium]|nr:phosphotransferase [Armatimonadota bacterium]